MDDYDEFAYEEMKELRRNRSSIIFGAASSGKRVLMNLLEKGMDKENLLFYDNNEKKWDTTVLGVPVISLPEFKLVPRKNKIYIGSCMHIEIIKQLDELSFDNYSYDRSLLYNERELLKYDEIFKDLLREVKETCNMDNDEKFTLYSSMKAVKGLEGDIAEVGVYKGGSAKILAEMKGRRDLFLFDTFEGLPKPKEEDLVKEGWLNDTSLESVQAYLKKYSGVYFYKGLFPTTASSIMDKDFALVHLDTDMYDCTFEALKFFYPRMVQYGRIISHDYNNPDCPGVKRAFNEYFKDERYKIIDVADTQGMVLKE